MRLIAPILSFTADEIWQLLEVNNQKSVFEDAWYDLPKHALTEKEISEWQDVISVRGLVNKAIEEKRAQSLVGSSLQSEIDIYADGQLFESLESLKDDLRFVMITSRAVVYKQAGSDVQIDVTPSTHAKCDRCWHYRADVGHHAEHPTICGRCVSNLFGAGEVRKYA